MILADKITEERKKNGWSQEELANQLGVSRQAVSKWESAGAVPDLQRILQMYLFDEPEAALSPQRQLTLLMQIYSCAKEGAQFIIVTHSPILLGIPRSEEHTSELQSPC